MLKKMLLGGFAAAMVFTTTAFAADVNVKLNGKAVEFENQQPTVVEGRTLIPLRGVFEEVGYYVGWDAETKSAWLYNGENDVTVTAGETEFTVNDEVYTSDVPAQIINGSMMLPIRAIGEAIGGEVEWDADTKTASITVEISEEMAFLLALEDAIEPLEEIYEELDNYLDLEEINESITKSETPEEAVNAVTALIDEDKAQKFLENADKYKEAFDRVKIGLDAAKESAYDDETRAFTEVYSEMIGISSDILSDYSDFLNKKITEAELTEKVVNKVSEFEAAINDLYDAQS